MAEPLAPHLEESLDSMSRIDRASERRVSYHQRWIEHATSLLGRPGTVYAILAFVAGWAGVNLALGERAFDALPFYGLQGMVSLAALLMTTLILTTENRQGQLAERRAQLELQLTSVTEAKVAKLIALIEALRRDDPLVANRADPEAEAMGEATDAQQMMEVMDDRSGAPEVPEA